MDEPRLDHVIALFEQALAIDREIADRRGEGYVLNNLGSVLYHQGDYPQARYFFEQLLVIGREILR